MNIQDTQIQESSLMRTLLDRLKALKNKEEAIRKALLAEQKRKADEAARNNRKKS